MVNPFGKSPLEKGRELAKEYPEEFKTVFTEYFIENTPWSDLAKYIGLFVANDLPFEPVTTRRQIENFTYYPLFELGEGDKHKVKGGDFDHINEPRKYDFIGGEKRKKAYSTAINNGAKIEVIMDKKGILKGGQTYVNAQDLSVLGIEVRCLDHPLHAAVNEKGSEISACVWENVQLDPDYVRREGFYQNPEKVRYEGFILNGKSEEHEFFTKALSSEIDMLKIKAEPLGEVLKEVHRKRFKPTLPLLNNGNSK